MNYGGVGMNSRKGMISSEECSTWHVSLINIQTCIFTFYGTFRSFSRAMVEVFLDFFLLAYFSFIIILCKMSDNNKNVRFLRYIWGEWEWEWKIFGVLDIAGGINLPIPFLIFQSTSRSPISISLRILFIFIPKIKSDNRIEHNTTWWRLIQLLKIHFKHF